MGKKSKYRLLSLATALSIILTGLGGASLISAAETESYGGGSGTELDPYIISSAEHMAQLDADTVAGNTDGKYYKLTADITIENLTVGQNKSSTVSSLCSESTYVTDIKPFKGVFDGNNHTVTYTYNQCYAYGGLFSGLEGAVVKNLTVKGTADGANVIFGSVAAVMIDSTIDNCISEVKITNAKKTTGGIAGIMQNSVISNTENRGNITTKKDSDGAPNVSHGGIDTHLRGIFTDLPANVFQGGHSNIGGIVSTAVNGATFTNVLNTGNVANNADNGVVSHTGGIVGLNYPGMEGAEIIFNSVGNTGNISVGKTNSNANDRTGGIFGRLENVRYYLNVVWSAGDISDSKSGDLLGATGSIGGSVSGSCGEISTDHIQRIYAKLGTVEDFTGTDCEDEFFGNPLYNNTTRYVYYSGDAYESTKGSYRDMMTDEGFLNDLGSGWRAVDGYAYPTLAYHFTVGDFNNDGAFDIRDLISLKKYLTGVGTGTDIVPAAADFDENGVVESTDLASVRKLLFGLSLKDVSASASKVLRVYSHNVCSHGDQPPGTGGETGLNSQRLPGICSVITENVPNVVVLTECNSVWAESIAQKCGYEIAENTRTGLSEIQILYNAGDFDLIENNVDDSERSAFHWVVLRSKATSEELMVYGYHGDATDSEVRATEIAAMNETVSAKALPTVVAGDFNAEYSAFSATLSGLTRTAEGNAYDKYTHLGWDSADNKTIDHILYSTDSFDARSFYVLGQKVGNTILSDHCALLSELKLK